MIIGYQGISGSNAWYTAEQYRKEHCKDAILMPLVNSEGVTEALKSGAIDIGVMAYRNSIAGEVEETKKAAEHLNLECLDVIILPIHHALLAKAGHGKIKRIASHIQALNQTKEYRLENYPDATEEETKDTALAAEMLEKGELSTDTAVIARKECADLYHLEILAECIEDRKDNETEFHVVRLKKKL